MLNLREFNPLINIELALMKNLRNEFWKLIEGQNPKVNRYYSRTSDSGLIIKIESMGWKFQANIIAALIPLNFSTNSFRQVAHNATTTVIETVISYRRSFRQK
jgi:hypothetical protein